jgi:uncharacterized membrane protein YdfJ with MMPL/SSD domain
VLSGLADFAHRRARAVVVGALALAVVAGALSAGVEDTLSSFSADDPASESSRAKAQLAAATGLDGNPGLVVLVRGAGPARSPATRAAVDAAVRIVRPDPATGRVMTPFDRGGEDLTSRDGRSTLLTVTFRAGQGEDAVERLRPRLARIDGATVGGSEVATLEVNEIVREDLVRAELLAFPLLFLLALWFFRSLVAALLPVLVGGVSIVLTLLALSVAAEAIDVSVFALNIVTGLGLGLAIDYSLFVVSRYREEIAVHGAGADALRATMATAGRTVLFSSLTVAAALASLLVFPQEFLYSMGLGGVLLTLSAAVVALTVLPAVLALLGERVNALAPRWLRRAGSSDVRPDEAGRWYRIARFVGRRPGHVALASAAVLIALGLPFLRVEFTSSDPTVLPASSDARRVFEASEREFPAYRQALTYVMTTGASPAELDRYVAQLESLPGAVLVEGPSELGAGVARVDMVSRAGELDGVSRRLVSDVRALHPPFATLVGGPTAEFVDQGASISNRLPSALAIVIATTFAVLFLMTGSVVLPVKAIVMNLVTLSAAFGVLVLIFQDGRLEGLLGYTSQRALEQTQPVVLFAIVFGLSTDYAVFLLARIKEARDGGATDREAVGLGLERAGRIVTAAALLFCVAIGAFATSRIVFIKEIGLGTGLAVLIDATIVRALLVPALMALLGPWNWWRAAPATAPARQARPVGGLAVTSPVSALAG